MFVLLNCWGWDKTLTLDGNQGQIVLKSEKQVNPHLGVRPSLRQTLWIIPNLWTIKIQVFCCLSHFSVFCIYGLRAQPYSSLVFTTRPGDGSPLDVSCCCCFKMAHRLPIGNTQVPVIISLTPASCTMRNCNFKVSLGSRLSEHNSVNYNDHRKFPEARGTVRVS